ncbi:dTDP-4-dehydrorhamnose reductase [Paenibacillus sp. SC116]|uniref:dTDP-4-dehydrorhamnose reductase n=1 Tax=Paenibacillus sp. SC116 TaxID=2968986 RepID=UPI00215A5CA2|nr:dTDP-4-dehydrorhamnose reductase [Paenibacillus sp. SC116]MCR8844160.1 dTDP-4-dehydrorhamnose reductase [Paenibacillus sp. SC116]
MQNNRPLLVTGASGQLGTDIMELLSKYNVPAVGCTRTNLDITDSEQVHEVIGRIKPRGIIHAAAYTKVDQAEYESDEAYRVNVYGSRNVAAAAESIGSKILMLSTDYVFDGRSTKPYDEFAAPRPINVYGSSKREAEKIVCQLNHRAFIVRTSWIFGRYGSNFVKAMLEQGKTNHELKVVHDQIGSPTYTKDLAECIIQLINTDWYGTYHVSNSGSCSWHQFACAIMEEAELQVKVRSVPTSQFPRPARRPAYSVLEGRALKLHGLSPLRPWREALADCVKALEVRN